ncbi:plasmid segregation actin-type ATPase ParM [Candidatus Allofournierella merdipullorum]|uniref:ParM/StbA family protein n=1 Tax=Candidatus Allofournierella merdipullorum TaxID=2838595 RepID=UPI002A84E021|nr:ParM/StbA family protein [Candidatus Fournierella merdipullorum]
MIMGIDHGYYAIKTRHFSFPAGVTVYTHKPYTLKNTLQIGGKYYVCGTGRQPILRDKTINENYYILTLAAIAMELRCRGLPAESSVILAAGLPLARYGRDKKSFTDYLFRNGQPVNFLFEGERYKIRIESVKMFPQGYSAIALHPELVKDEPSVLLMDIGGWTVDLMWLDNNVPNAATCRSLELGMIRCMDEIQEQVRRDTGLSVTDAQVERILAGKPCSMDEEARKLIQRQGRLYTERLISAAMEAGFDLRTLPVILMGGGAATVMRNVGERDGLCNAPRRWRPRAGTCTSWATPPRWATCAPSSGAPGTWP